MKRAHPWSVGEGFAPARRGQEGQASRPIEEPGNRRQAREERVESKGAGLVVPKGSQEAGVVSEGEQERAQVQGDELETVREVILRAHPDVVPELVQGQSVAELMASIEPARAAFQAVIERTRQSGSSYERQATSDAKLVETPPKVPAGGGVATLSVDDLPASEKIKRGIAGRR